MCVVEVLPEQRLRNHHHYYIHNQFHWYDKDVHLQDSWLVGLPRRNYYHHANVFRDQRIDHDMQKPGVVWLQRPNTGRYNHSPNLYDDHHHNLHSSWMVRVPRPYRYTNTDIFHGASYLIDMRHTRILLGLP